MMIKKICVSNLIQDYRCVCAFGVCYYDIFGVVCHYTFGVCQCYILGVCYYDVYADDEYCTFSVTYDMHLLMFGDVK